MAGRGLNVQSHIYGISNFFRRFALRVCLVAGVVGSLVIPVRAQQYINFSYNGTGLASGEDATVLVHNVTYSAKIERKQVSGVTHYLLTVLAISYAGPVNWSPDGTHDPGLVVTGSGGEVYPGGTMDLGASPTSVTTSMFKQILASGSKYHFGGITTTLSVPRTSTTAVTVTNPIDRPMSVELYGIKVDGSFVLLRTETLAAGSTAMYQVQADATLYPGGVHVGGVYHDSAVDGGTGDVIDGSGDVVFSLGSVGWQAPVDYDPSLNNITPVKVDTSDSTVPAQVVAGNTVTDNSAISGSAHITNNNLYGISGAATDALTKGAMQTIANGIIDAANYNGNSVVAAVKGISVTSGGGGGGSTDMTATNGKLDTANAKLEDLKTKVDASNAKLDVLHTDLTTANADLTAAVASGIGTADGIAASVDGLISSATTNANSAVGTRGSGVTAVTTPTFGVDSVAVDTIPVGSGTFAAFEFNPARSATLPDWASDLIAWVRAIIGWGAVAGLYAYAGHAIRGAIGVSILTPTQPAFAAERALNSSALTAAGSLTVRVALMAALLAAFVAMPSAFIQLFSTDWKDLLNAFASTASAPGSVSSNAKSVFAVANDFAPLATLFSVASTYVVFEWLLLPVQMVWQFAARFCAI